jgi:hypothetical protein
MCASRYDRFRARGDCFLICSDGLHGYLRTEEIPPIIAEGGHSSVLQQAFVPAPGLAGRLSSDLAGFADVPRLLSMHRAIWGIVALTLIAGCGSPTVDGESREVVEVTTGSRQDALYALAAARNLVLGLKQRDLSAVSDAALRLGFGAADITFGEPLSTVAAATRFDEPGPAPKPHTTGCYATGCDYAHHLDGSFYPNWIDGSVGLTSESGVDTIAIELVVHNDSWASAEVAYVTGQLEVAAGTLNGAVTEVTESVHDTTDRQQVRFERMAFDEAAGPSAEPSSGVISANWAAAQLPRKGATISFP